jgi:TonB family protein
MPRTNSYPSGVSSSGFETARAAAGNALRDYGEKGAGSEQGTGGTSDRGNGSPGSDSSRVFGNMAQEGEAKRAAALAEAQRLAEFRRLENEKREAAEREDERRETARRELEKREQERRREAAQLAAAREQREQEEKQREAARARRRISRPVQVISSPSLDVSEDLLADVTNRLVKARFVVAADGSATFSITASSGSSSVDRLAAKAFKRWRFQPKIVDGEARASTYIGGFEIR